MNRKQFSLIMEMMSDSPDTISGNGKDGDLLLKLGDNTLLVGGYCEIETPFDYFNDRPGLLTTISVNDAALLTSEAWWILEERYFNPQATRPPLSILFDDLCVCRLEDPIFMRAGDTNKAAGGEKLRNLLLRGYWKDLHSFWELAASMQPKEDA